MSGGRGEKTAQSLSLIVAVYNRPDALRLVLAACALQTLKPSQIVIADDGSGPAIAETVRDARKQYMLTITHVRHDDAGWRKNRILNDAVRVSAHDYLVFIDGDCVPHRRFFEDHAAASAHRTVVCGRRVELSPSWTARITLDTIRSGAYQRIGPAALWEGVRGRALRLEDGLRLPLLARLAHRGARGMLGSNFSLWKDDLESINGFDEEYAGPGCGEDSDVEYRLGLAGVAPRVVRHRAIQYHLWHPRGVMSEQSIARFARVRAEARAVCEHGLAERRVHAVQAEEQV